MDPRRRRRRILVRTLLALALLGLLGYAGFVGYVSWKSADSLIHPSRDHDASNPALLGFAYENVTFTSADGYTLVAWWVPERVAGHNGTVVFLHGYGESKNQSLDVAKFLLPAGYDVLAFDFRAHGDSEGEYTTVGLDEVADVRAAVDYLGARGDVDMTRLALMGWSMGGATAINAGANIPEARAFITDSAFATLTNIASNSITHFTGLSKYPYGPLSVVFAGWMVDRDIGDNRPIDAIPTLRRPVLIIQGEADDIALPHDDGIALYRMAPEGSELWLVPGATHVTSIEVDRAQYETRVLEFLSDHVQPRTGE